MYHEMFGVPRSSFPCGGSGFTDDVYFSPNYHELQNTEYPEDNNSGISWDTSSIQHFLNSDNTHTQTDVIDSNQIIPGDDAPIGIDWSKVLYRRADAVDPKAKVVLDS